MPAITFNNPQYLWFLVALPVLIIGHFIALKYTHKKAIKFANFEAIARVTHGHILSKNYGLLISRLLVITCVIFSASGTVIWYIGQTSNFDFMIAIDSSTSMLAKDLLPTRLEAAKNSALNFIDILDKKANIGIISFATTSIVEIEPTINAFKLKEALGNVNIKRIGGTNLGDAIIISANQLLNIGRKQNPGLEQLENNNKAESRGKAIILLTDGQGTVGEDSNTAIKYAQENNIVIHTIGIGTDEGSIFAELNITAIPGIKTKLDEEGLKKIASFTSGKYFSAKQLTDLSSAYNEIASITEKPNGINLSISLMVVAFILLLIEWLLVNTKYTTIP